METASLLVSNFIALTLDASPWLLLGLLIAGLMKAWLPSQLLAKHLGQGNSAIVKAALVGAPLPLCSCGVIPVATELKRSGASSPATSSFLVATPETGVDSITVSYAMLGPFFALFRPISAVVSAIATGFLVKTAKPIDTATQAKTQSTCCHSATKDEAVQATDAKQAGSSWCSSKQTKTNSAAQKTLQGVKYALTQLIDDIIKWLLIGLLFATLVKTFVPTELLTTYGSGIPAMLLMILISIPMYICATASTPIAAGFIFAGISPGTALVFMMAGPATNISTLGVIKNEMGTSVLSRYLVGISVSAIAFGLLLDELVNVLNIDINQQMQHSHELLPLWLSAGSALLLFTAAIKPIRRKILN